MRRSFSNLNLSEPADLERYFSQHLLTIATVPFGREQKQYYHDAVSSVSLELRNTKNEQFLFANQAASYFAFLRKLNSQSHDGASPFSPWYELRNSLFHKYSSDVESLGKKLLQINPEEFFSVVEESISPDVASRQGNPVYSEVMNQNFLEDIFFELTPFIFTDQKYEKFQERFRALFSKIKIIDSERFSQLIQKDEIGDLLALRYPKIFSQIFSKLGQSNLSECFTGRAACTLLDTNSQEYSEALINLPNYNLIALAKKNWEIFDNLFQVDPANFLRVLEKVRSVSLASQGTKADFMMKDYLLFMHKCLLFPDISAFVAKSFPYIEEILSHYSAQERFDLFINREKSKDGDFILSDFAKSLLESHPESFFKIVANFDSINLKLFIQSQGGGEIIKSYFELFEKHILPKFSSEQDIVNLYCAPAGESIVKNKAELFYEKLTKVSPQIRNIMLASGSGQAFLRKEFLDVESIMKKEEELNEALQLNPKDRFLIRGDVVEIRTSPAVLYEAEYGRLNEICQNKVQSRVEPASRSNVLVIPIDSLMARLKSNRENAIPPAAAPSLTTEILRSASNLGAWLLSGSSPQKAGAKDV